MVQIKVIFDKSFFSIDLFEVISQVFEVGKISSNFYSCIKVYNTEFMNVIFASEGNLEQNALNRNKII